jgi:hypothetical protein
MIVARPLASLVAVHNATATYRTLLIGDGGGGCVERVP